MLCFAFVPAIIWLFTSVAWSASIGGPQHFAPIDVVLLLDGSKAMTGEPSRWVTVGSVRFLDRFGPGLVRQRAVAVVRFDSSASVLCPLTPDIERLSVCVKRVGAKGGGSRLDLGLTTARRLLSASAWRTYPGSRQVVVAVSGSRPTDRTPDWPWHAAGSTALPETFAVCLSPGCDPTALRGALGRVDRMLVLHDATEVPAAMELIATYMDAGARSIYVPVVNCRR